MPSPLTSHTQPAETKHPITVEDFSCAIDDALRLFQTYGPPPQSSPLRADSTLPSLIDQCMTLCAQPSAAQKEPIRTIHHFACTGGTLISKCIAAMPNTQLLSEIDPLSDLSIGLETPRFSPTDLIAQARQSTRGVPTNVVIELFLSSLDILHAEAENRGHRLVLRDHSHSQFCTAQEASARLTLREIVQRRHKVLSVITVRHPIDTFISLCGQGWDHFRPPTFDEYCSRHLSFLLRYKGVPVIRYEDFINSPSQTMQQICTALALPYQDRFGDLFNAFKLTGDSGRTSDQIARRERRAPSAGLLRAAVGSIHYHQLSAILRYDP